MPGLGLGPWKRRRLPPIPPPAPALALDFLASEVLDARITAAGGTNGTRVNSAGVIVGQVAPRFDFDPVSLAPRGLLIEEARTNLALRNAEFDHASWAKTNATVTANLINSPAGTLTGDKLVETATNTTHFVRQTIAAAATTAYTNSWYVKAGERARGQLQMFGNGGGCTANFDLAAGTNILAGAGHYGGWANGACSIAPAGDGWFRLTMTATTNVGAATVACQIMLCDGTGNTSYLGDGASGFYLWGGQAEQGDFASSWIPTLDAPVARSADLVSMTGTNFSSWWNAAAGSAVVDFDLIGQPAAGTGRIWLISTDGTNYIALRQGVVIGGIDAFVMFGGAGQVDSPSLPALVATPMKAAMAWSAASSNLAARGVLAGSDDTAAVIPACNRFEFGSAGWAHIRKFTYYNTRLTNLQLQAAAMG